MISSYSAARSPTRSSRNVAKPAWTTARVSFGIPRYAASRIRMWLKRNASSPPTPSASGITISLRISSWRLAPTSAALRIRREAHDRLPAEDAADHGRPLDDRALPRREPVEPSRQQRLDRRRDHGSPELDVRLPAIVPLREQPVVDQHPQHLLDEERIALGRGDDLRTEIPGDVLAEQVGDEQLALLRAERLEHDRARVGQRSRPRRHRLGELGPSRTQDQDRRAAAESGEVLDQVQERRLGPVDVVEHDDDRVLLREGLEQPPHRPRDLLRSPEHVVEPDRPCQARRDEPSLVGVRRQLGQLRACLLASLVVVDSGEALEHDREREVRDPLSVGDAAALEHGRAILDPLHELLRQPRLARAGGCQHRHDLARRAARRALERLDQPPQLGLAPDDRRVQLPRAPRRIRVDREQAIRGKRLALALGGEGLDRLDRHCVADEPICRLADQHLSGRRRLLEPGGDVHRVARRERAPAGDVARHDFAGVDARPNLDPDTPVPLELDVQDREGISHLGSRANGPKGVVLVENRDPERGHDRVAHELLERPAVSLDHLRGLAEVARHHLSHRLRIEPLAERGRARDVAEEHRHRPSGVDRERARSRQLRSGSARRGSRSPRNRGPTLGAELRAGNELRAAAGAADGHGRPALWTKARTGGAFATAAGTERHDASVRRGPVGNRIPAGPRRVRSGGASRGSRRGCRRSPHPTGRRRVVDVVRLGRPSTADAELRASSASARRAAPSDRSGRRSCRTAARA